MKQRLLASVLLVFFFSAIFCGPLFAAIPDLTSPAAMLMDAESGQVLFEKSAHEKRPMASTTKMMTAILVLERKTLHDSATVSAEAANTDGSGLGLAAGESRTIEELLYALMLRSANDASIVLAEDVGESTSNFVNLMNEKAKQLGARQTHFTNPHGLYDPGHYSTPYDLALIAREGLRNQTFAKLVGTKQMSISGTAGNAVVIENRNKLLWQYQDANGVKTGHVRQSGYCLVGAGKRNGVQLITVVLGALLSRQAYDDSIKLLDHGFTGFNVSAAIRKNKVYKKVEFPARPGQPLALKAAATLHYLDGEGVDLKRKITVKRDPSLPVSKNQKLGRVTVFQGKQKLGTVDLVAAQAVSRPTLAERVVIFLKTLFAGS